MAIITCISVMFVDLCSFMLHFIVKLFFADEILQSLHRYCVLYLASGAAIIIFAQVAQEVIDIGCCPMYTFLDVVINRLFRRIVVVGPWSNWEGL